MKKLILFLLILTSIVFIYFLVFKQQSIVIHDFKPKLVKKRENHVVPVGGYEMGNNMYQCSVDEDCILVSVGKCCDFVAVNKNFKDEIKSTPMICTRVCYTKAICKKGICQVTETK